MPPQNIYDNNDFYANYMQLPRQVDGLKGAPEWPTIQALLPDLGRKRVVDLGCGVGYFSRYARENGAIGVLGLDISENMIARAKQYTYSEGENAGLSAIQYRIEDLETLELPKDSFDFAFSALTFHYLKDFGRLVRMVFRSLTPGSHFVFEIEHPIFLAAVTPHWTGGEGGEGGEKKSWAVNSYSHEGERERDWFVKGVRKYHRTMATTLNTLIAEGFTIRKVVEYAPSKEDMKADPSLELEAERPMFLIISAQR